MTKEKRIEIYKGAEGEVIFDIDTDGETIWATQAQMAEVFGVDRTVIGRHVRNILKDGELEAARVCAKNAHTGPDGKTYQVQMHNLDMIISVGYRVNSAKATKFRIWATKVLKKYIVGGVAVNERRLKAMAEQEEVQKLRDVEKMMALVKRLTEHNRLESGEATGVIEVISRYAGSFETLAEYDSGTIDLSFMKRNNRQKELTPEMCYKAVEELKASVRGNAEFGQIRTGMEPILSGLEKYESVAEKSANLLYEIVKNRPFVDGNKRIGALLFILFLTLNDYHLTEKGETKISDRALTAITLLIAESEPKEKTLIINLVCKLLE